MVNAIASTPEEARALLHELQVHQTQLKMQNEELMRIHHELATAHASYLDLYDFAPVGYCTVCEKGLITKANLTLANLLGVTRLTLTQHLFSSYIQRDDQDEFYHLHRQLLAAKTVAAIPAGPVTITPAVCEVRLVKSDGTDCWSRLTVTLAADTQGEKALRIAVTDITEQRQLAQQLHELQQAEHRDTKAALRVSEEGFRVIFEAQPECVKIVDATGCLVQTNAAGLALMEVDSLQQVQGLSCAGFVVASQREAYRAFEASVLGGNSEAIEFEMIGLKGTRRWVVSHAVPLPDQQNDAPKMLAIIRDITARKQADERIRWLNNERSQFKNTLDQTLESIFIFDPQSLRFNYVNQGAMQQTGYSEAELMQKTAVVIKPELVLEQFQQVIQPLIDGVQPSITFQTVHHHKDGHDIPVEVFLQLVRTEGQDPRFVAMVSDISESKRIELELISAKDEAQQANAYKSTFLANMSHEIRTPMNGVLGLLELLQCTELSERQRDYAAKAESSALSLLGIIDDILDFSKVEAGKLTLDPEPFKVSQLARDLETILSANLRGKPLTLHVEVDLLMPELVIGDANRLRQVLINLGGNAIKFTAHGEVRVSLLIQQLTEREVVLAIEVNDTGIGLSADQQVRIFDSFAQADNSTSRHFGGTGLGLSISHRLLALMGAQLQVRSELGVGSTFYFSLALELPDAKIVETLETLETLDALERPSLKPLDGLRVLLAEDNLINQVVVKSLLENHGAQVTVVYNGQLAVNVLLVTPEAFDVVLMDMQMPVMDGLQATRHIRQQLKLTQLPVIAMTANVLATDYQNCLDAGMNDHVGKPFKVQDLVDLMKQFTRPKDPA